MCGSRGGARRGGSCAGPFDRAAHCAATERSGVTSDGVRFTKTKPPHVSTATGYRLELVASQSVALGEERRVAELATQTVGPRVIRAADRSLEAAARAVCATSAGHSSPDGSRGAGTRCRTRSARPTARGRSTRSRRRPQRAGSPPRPGSPPLVRRTNHSRWKMRSASRAEVLVGQVRGPRKRPHHLGRRLDPWGCLDRHGRLS